MLNLPRLATRVAIAATAGVLSACSAITFGIANAPASFGPFERKADIPYGADERQKLDVYLPKPDADAPAVASTPLGATPSATVMASAISTTPAPSELASNGAPAVLGRPVVIFWYGGSWTNGSKSDYRFVGAAL